MKSPVRSLLAQFSALFVGLSVTLSSCADEPETLETVYRILVEPCTGSENQRATAVAVGPDLLMTVAHSFEGAKTITVTDSRGEMVQIELVYLDQAKDIAVLRPAAATPAALQLGEPEESGAVSIATFANADGPESKQAEILELVEATLDGEGRRSAIRLDAAVEPGDSGAPVVDEQNEMVGMIFAKARGNDIGWAISAVELTDVVELLHANRPEEIPLTCQP